MRPTRENVLARQAALFYTGSDRTQILAVLVITQNVGSPQQVEAAPRTRSGVRHDLGNHQKAAWCQLTDWPGNSLTDYNSCGRIAAVPYSANRN